MSCRLCFLTFGSKSTLNTSFKNACKKRLTVLAVRANVARSDGARRLDRGSVMTERIGMVRQIRVELLPHERAVLLKGRFTVDEVRAQLKACASSEDIETITMTAVDVHWLAADLPTQSSSKAVGTRT
jgi:hypothetical protein